MMMMKIYLYITVSLSRITTGAQDDLQKVTKMAYAQIRFSMYGASTAGPFWAPLFLQINKNVISLLILDCVYFRIGRLVDSSF